MTSRRKSKPPKIWISNQHFTLYESDRECILSPTGWLTDDVINAVQIMLSEQFPSISGLQDVSLGCIMNFTVQNGEFLQILHAINHWVTISTIGSQQSAAVVNLYDSNYMSIPTLLQAQIACILRTEQEDITVNVMNVQSQVIIF